MRSTDSSDRRRPSRIATVAAVVLIAIVLATTVATPVVAHAYLSDADPANGEQVETLPEDVTLFFSGDGVQVADVTVTGPDGEAVSGDATVDPDDTQIVRTPLEAPTESDDADGMYTVEWEVLADDGHTTSGTFFFSVGDEPLDRDAVLEAYDDEDDVDESVPPVETAAKGLVLVALVALIGGPLTAAIAVYPAASRVGVSAQSVDRRLTRLLGGASVLLFGSVVALGLVQARSVGPLVPGTLLEFAGLPLGHAWLGQLAFATVVVAVLGTAVAGSLSRRGWLAGTVVGAVGVAGAVSWTSHSATAIGRLQGFAVDLAHIAGAGLWVGGLVVLALVVPPLLRDTAPADRTALAAGTVRRYSVLALAGVTLAGATGLILAAWHVPTLEALGETVYGTALSAKTLLVLLALGLGGFTRFFLLRRLEAPTDAGHAGFGGRLSGSGSESVVREDGGQPERETITTLRRAVTLEVGILVVVLLLSGVLTSAPTAAVAGDDTLGSATIEREGDVDLALTVTPVEGDGDDRFLVGAGEPVVFEVAFIDDHGSSVASDRTVRLSADGPDDTFDVDLEETDDGTYATVQTLPADGDWELRVTGSPDGQFVSEWFDAHASPASDAHDHGDHDHDEHDEHDHGDDHDHHDHDDHGDDHDGEPDESPSPFVTLLQFGAVVIGVVGTVAVALEATRDRDRRE